MKQLLLLFLLLNSSGIMAQTVSDREPDKKVTFHFYVGNEAFIFPGRENEKLFNDACKFMDTHRAGIEQGKMHIEVFGHCGQGGTDDQRRASVKRMSNYVKGEFIHRKKAAENNFTTRNSIQSYSSAKPNVVVVSFIIPVDSSKIEAEAKANAERLAAEQAKEEQARRLAAERAAKEKAETERLAQEEAEAQRIEAERLAQERTNAEQAERQALALKKMRHPYKLALRTNLLHWLAATPNIGVEWRPASVFSLLVDADWAPWRWNNKLNYYRIWNLQPQVRFHMGAKRAFYLGGEFHTGELNWKTKTKGTQGDFIGGGLVAGYRLKLNRSLDLDFNLGAGYTSYDYDKYEDVDGFLFPYDKGLNKKYWGLTSAGVSLVWKLCK